MRENMKMRLYGLGFLGMMLLFLFLGLHATNRITGFLGFLTSGIWLVAFLIVQFHVIKLEIKREKKC